jgi:hypothetical protein
MQAYVLQRIHDGHQGINKCRERAKSSVYWIGISSQIKAMIENCQHCAQHAKTQRREPMIASLLPLRPWQKLATDLLDFEEKTYIVVMDYYSRFIELEHLHGTVSRDIIKVLKSIFARHRIPDLLISDNGPWCASSEFAAFAND